MTKDWCVRRCKRDSRGSNNHHKGQHIHNTLSALAQTESHLKTYGCLFAQNIVEAGHGSLNTGCVYWWPFVWPQAVSDIPHRVKAERGTDGSAGCQTRGLSCLWCHTPHHVPNLTCLFALQTGTFVAKATSDLGGPCWRLCGEQTRQLPDNTFAPPPPAWQSKERKIWKCAAHLCVGVVGVPGRPERFLPPYIPHQEVSVLHHYFFHVTSDGGGCVDHLVHQTWPEENRKVRFLHIQTRRDKTSNKDLQLIEDSGFPSVVESNNDDLVLCETSKHGRQSRQVWYCEAAGQTEETKCRFTPDTSTPKHPNIVVWLFRPSEPRLLSRKDVRSEGSQIWPLQGPR